MVRLGSSVVQKQKLGTAGTLIYLKYKNKVRLGFYIVENAKIRDGQMYDWGFIC